MDEISYLLKPGTYYVDASIGDESLEDVEITVSAGANTRKIVFAAEETGEARIIVKMTDGTPIPESHAKLLLGTEEIASAWGSNQGIIELSASPGTYKLEVRMEVINELLKHEDEITIEAGEIATKEVVFENVGMLTLTFEDGSGNPLSDVTVILKDSDKKLLSENSFMEEISYLLKPGTYYVDAEKLGVKVENHEIVVTAGAQTATISVPLVTIGNVAAGKEYRMVKPPQPQYADSSGKKLTDGEYATSSYLDPAWVGTLGEGEGQGENEFWQILVLDLGEKYDILGIWLECLRDDESGIKTPKRLRVAVSENGYTWNLLPWKDFPEPENLTVAPLSYEAITSARFVAFYIEQRWNWLFMSEVEVRGILGGGTPVDGDLDAIELTPDIFLVP